MTSQMSITNIGEELTAALLERLKENESLADIMSYLWSVSLKKWEKTKLGEIHNAFIEKSVDVTFVPKLKIEDVNEELKFDGMAEVDVAAIIDKKVLAFEAKLGESRLSPEEFTKRFLGKCRKSDHDCPRVAGSMCRILDHRVRELLNVPAKLRVKYELRECVLESGWVLVLRKNVFDKWCSKSKAPEFSNFPAVICIEDMARTVGEKGFNEIVKDIVGGDFYQKWKMQ